MSSSELRPDEEWLTMDSAPMDGTGITVLLSNGHQIYAEYWSGPDEHPEWGGWGWDGTEDFLNGRNVDEDYDAEWVGWKPCEQREVEPGDFDDG